MLRRLRYRLRLRDLVEMFLVRSYEFTHETTSDWEARFAQFLAEQLLRAKRREQARKSWYVDETSIKVRDRRHSM
jgi:transposase-like protein